MKNKSNCKIVSLTDYRSKVEAEQIDEIRQAILDRVSHLADWDIRAHNPEALSKLPNLNL